MDIIGYTDYLIYDDGRVYSKKSNKFLVQKLSGRDYLLEGGGYNKVVLSLNGKTKNKIIHRLVAEHYIPNPNNLKCVDHIDRNKQNNHYTNLRWTTYQKNSQNTDKFRNNTSGHKGINFKKKDKLWRYQKQVNYKYYTKSFKTIKEALCYKYIFLLRMKANHFK